MNSVQSGSLTKGRNESGYVGTDDTAEHEKNVNTICEQQQNMMLQIPQTTHLQDQVHQYGAGQEQQKMWMDEQLKLKQVTMGLVILSDITRIHCRQSERARARARVTHTHTQREREQYTTRARVRARAIARTRARISARVRVCGRARK